MTSCADREANIDEAQKYKRKRYKDLVTDIDCSGRQATFEPFEVCALGNIRSDSRKTLARMVGKKSAKSMFKNLSKIAISCSYYIFNQRNQPEWPATNLFQRSTDNG